MRLQRCCGLLAIDKGIPNAPNVSWRGQAGLPHAQHLVLRCRRGPQGHVTVSQARNKGVPHDTGDRANTNQTCSAVSSVSATSRMCWGRESKGEGEGSSWACRASWVRSGMTPLEAHTRCTVWPRNSWGMTLELAQLSTWGARDQGRDTMVQGQRGQQVRCREERRPQDTIGA